MKYPRTGRRTDRFSGLLVVFVSKSRGAKGSKAPAEKQCQLTLQATDFLPRPEGKP